MFDKSSLLCEALVSQYDTYGAVLCVYLQFVHITSDNFDTYIFVNDMSFTLFFQRLSIYY